MEGQNHLIVIEIHEYSNLVENMSTTNINYLSLPSMLGRAGYWCGRNSECLQITHCYKYATTIPFHIKLRSINITGIELWLQQWEVGALFIALLGHHRLFLSISYINVWFNILDKSEYMYSIYYRIKTITIKPSEFNLHDQNKNKKSEISYVLSFTSITRLP